MPADLLNETELREHVEWLAALTPRSASPGERAAGERIATTLEGLGHRAHRDRERVHGTYWWAIRLAAAASALAGLSGRRGLGSTAGALGALSCADDISAGPRLVRRLLPGRDTVNVWTAI